jgi:hypothetical protein
MGIEGIDTNNWPLWLIVSVFIGLMIYRDIVKPYFEKKLLTKIETEKKNTEVKKFNEEAERWNKLLRYIEHNAIDIISPVQSQLILTSVFQNAAKDFLLRVYDFIEKNDIKNVNRQKVITSHVETFLKDQKNRIIRAIQSLTCNGMSLGVYVKQVNTEHTNQFMNDVLSLLFAEMDNIRKKDDLQLLIISHYNQHINEAIEFLNLKN